MGRRSVKFKITLWYTLITAVVSVAALVAMTTLSARMMNADIKEGIVRTADKLARELETSPELRMVPNFKYYERGVNMELFDDDGNAVRGMLPFEVDGKITFSDKGVRTESYGGNRYYVFDRRVNRRGGSAYWLKGVVPVAESMNAVGTVAKNNALFMLVMIVVAAAGGYIIVGRILTPVKKIRETADEISESRDLTRRIGMSDGGDEFHSLAGSFDRMLDRIQQTVEREKQFTSDASHELRTPVAAILSSCEYMTGYAESMDDMRDSAEGIKRETERMSKLISELLMISRMDKNTLKASMEKIDLGELVSFVCDEQEEINRSGSITLHRDISEGIFVLADRYMLARLAINLISNAYTYGRDGGNITVSLTESGGCAALEVADDGIGISAEDIPRTWERFYRVDASRTATDKQNMGLGLSIVSQIAAFHGGDVQVESENGKGSKFTFKMPIADK